MTKRSQGRARISGATLWRTARPMSRGKPPNCTRSYVVVDCAPDELLESTEMYAFAQRGVVADQRPDWCTPGAGESLNASKSSLVDARTAAAIGGDVAAPRPSDISAAVAELAEIAAAE